MPSPFNFTGTSFGTLDSTSGIEGLPPGPDKPAVCNLAAAYNVRFNKEGGVGPRRGFTLMEDVGSSAKIDSAVTLPYYSVTFWKSGTAIYIATKDQLDSGNSYTIGVTRTAAEKDFLFVNERDVYATNETDAYLRIAVAKATVVIADSDVTITVDEIDQFASGGGTVYINGDSISYTGVSGSTLTGVTGIATGGHAVNSIVTQTSTPSGAPKGTCIAALEGSALVGKRNTISASLPATDQEPEFFYDFTLANGATTKRMSSNVNALKTGLGVCMIGMSAGIDVSSGFEINSGALLTAPLTRVHGVPNAWCIVETDKEFAILTNEGRILLALNTPEGFVISDDPDNPRNNFDYPVQGYIQKNKDQSDNSKNFLTYNPATRVLKATILMLSGLTEEVVCRRDIGAWSVDTGKNFSCRTVVQGVEYCGDDVDDKIYRDDYGATDNGVPIVARMTTGRLRLGRRGVTADYTMLTYGGTLNEGGQFNQRIFYNDAVDDVLVLAEDMVGAGQMSLSSGVSLGEGDMVSESLGTAGDTMDVFTFNRPYETLADAEYVVLEWEWSDEGSTGEIRYFDLSGEHEAELLVTPA